MGIVEHYTAAAMEPFLEHVRQKIAAANVFGVTVQENHLTLRTTVGGRHTTLHFVAVTVETVEPTCAMCNEPLAAEQTTYPIALEIRHDGRTVRRETVQICGECAR